MLTPRLVLSLALCGLPSLPAQQVWTVDGSGGAQYTTIAAAVAAARDGDVIRVAAGGYAPFAVNGKSLTIVSAGATVSVSGVGPVVSPPPITIENITAVQRVHLSGISVFNSVIPPAAVLVRNCAGSVRMHDAFIDSYGAPALVIEDCLDVVLDDVFAQTNAGITLPGGVPQPMPGARVLRSHLRGYDCDFAGSHGVLQNNGFPVATSPAEGGVGLDIIDSAVTMAGGECRGGTGSTIFTPACQFGGNGGDAVRLSTQGVTAPSVHLRNVGLLPGWPGWSTCGAPAVMGQTSRVLGGQLVLDPGSERLLRCAAEVQGAAFLPITVFGEQQDISLVFAAFPAPMTEVLGLPLYLSLAPAPIALGLVTSSSNGSAWLLMTIPALGPSMPVAEFALQALVLDAGATAYATNPRPLVLR